MSEQQPIDEQAKRRVEAFILAVTEAAIFDASEGINEYDQRSTGQKLLGRLNLRAYRHAPRNGDGKYARSLYTAVRWLYLTEVPPRSNQ